VSSGLYLVYFYPLALSDWRDIVVDCNPPVHLLVSRERIARRPLVSN
jgi:hypothetical protein